MANEVIFVVDDEENIQHFIKYNLEANGFNVVIFGNGEDLLNELKMTIVILRI